VAATFEKAKTCVFAGMVIHNPKVGGSIPPPATNYLLIFNNLYERALSSERRRVDTLWTKQTAQDVYQTVADAKEWDRM